MESLKLSIQTMLLLCLTISSLIPCALADQPSGTIERTTRQQILATLPPGSGEASEPFLASPSGKYTGHLFRRETAPGAGGFGNDFCYVGVVDAGTGQSVWESECAPVSAANACALVFDDDGLAVFDGSNPVWDTGAESADNNPLETVEMVDEGDMRIRDRIGELAWKASEDPRSSQGCGLPGSPGLGPALPPFAQPIGGQVNQPFGQQQQPQPQSVGLKQEQQQQGVGGGVVNSQSSGYNSQPLVDSTPYDSGCLRGVVDGRVGMGWALVLGLLACCCLMI